LLVCTVYSTVLYSEIALSQKPFGIGHVYTYIFVLRMTYAMTFQNLSYWDTLYVGLYKTRLRKYTVYNLTAPFGRRKYECNN
jgi:hypothetical protein